jgi:predicted murein hydrolase (TIGR00659 family)
MGGRTLLYKGRPGTGNEAVKAEIFALWVYLSATPLLGLTLTLVAYQVGLSVAQRAKSHPLANPVFIAMILIATLLAATDTPYQTYFEGAQFVHFLLGTATVALAVAFYERLSALRRNWRALAFGLACGATASMIAALVLAKWLGASPATVASLIPKSVTAPIAMGISEAIGGVPTLSAVFCILTGIVGAASGKLIFDALGIKDIGVRGFALGAQAHGIGTARAYLVSTEAGAFAGLALGLHGLIASLLLPFIGNWFVN